MSFQSVHKILALVFLLCVGFDLVIADVLFPHCAGHIEANSDEITTAAHHTGESHLLATAHTVQQPDLASGRYAVDENDGCDHCCFGCCSHITSTTVFTFARPDVPPLVFAAEPVPLVMSLWQRLYRPPKSF